MLRAKTRPNPIAIASVASAQHARHPAELAQTSALKIDARNSGARGVEMNAPQLQCKLIISKSGGHPISFHMPKILVSTLIVMRDASIPRLPEFQGLSVARSAHMSIQANVPI